LITGTGRYSYKVNLARHQDKCAEQKKNRTPPPKKKKLKKRTLDSQGNLFRCFSHIEFVQTDTEQTAKKQTPGNAGQKSSFSHQKKKKKKKKRKT
jgi:hypothetical protein